MNFMIYWLMAGFGAFFLTQHLQGRNKITTYDDSYWMVIFGGFISLISLMIYFLFGDDEKK